MIMCARSRLAALGLLCGIAVLTLSLPRPAFAQAYPNKSIRLVVPFGPGGSADGIARPLATKLGAALGVSVVIDNRPGGLTVIGADAVAKSAPDGYTLYFMPGTHVLIDHMVKSVPFDPRADFTPIATVGFLPYVIVANSERPYKTLAQLLDYARANPEAVTMGVSDAVTRVAASSLESLAKAKFTIVEYKGGGPLGTDLVGNQIGAAVGAANLMPFVQQGKLVPLATTTPKPVSFLPGVPSVSDLVPGSNFDVQTWYAIVGPAKLPPAIVDRLAVEIRKLLAEPDMKARLDSFGIAVPDNVSPAATAELMRQYEARMTKLLQSAGITPQ